MMRAIVSLVLLGSLSYAQGGRSQAPQMQASESPRVTIDAPRAGGRVTVARGSDGLLRFGLRGSAKHLSNDGRLLLWVKPTRPTGDGWYLQRPPLNGIAQPDVAGWTGIAQLGREQWPPRNGDEMDIAITLTDRRTATKLFAEEGVVVRDRPVGTVLASSTGLVVVLR